MNPLSFGNPLGKIISFSGALLVALFCSFSRRCFHSSKQEISTQHCFNAGPPSTTTLVQHTYNIGLTSHVEWDGCPVYIFTGQDRKRWAKNVQTWPVLSQHIALLDMKGCICHFVKWQMHPFISRGAICW